MRLITKPKLPKWIMAILPFREEDELFTGIIVPFILFSSVEMGIIWHELYESLIPFLGTVITILIFVLAAVVIGWLVVQVDILRILRLRLVIHYKNTKNEEERIKTRRRLSDLCVKV